MKKVLLVFVSIALSIQLLNAQNLSNKFKFYGFVRNYMAFDTRESLSGTGDLYYYLPKDEKINEKGDDLNKRNQFRFLAITSRVGVDVTGFELKKTAIGGKIEADFYAGLSGVTGTANMRLRQAYLTLSWKDLPMSKNNESKASVNLKMGQAWHPMAADLCPVFSLASGVPFGPFSRTPQVTMDAKLGKNFMLTASTLWQMQYTSAGPAGSSANYIKYSCTPELYIGASVFAGGFLARAGVDVLSIKPANLVDGDGVIVNSVADADSKAVKVADRITTFSPFVYMQYVKNKFAVKAKTIYAQAGEHMNIQGGYGVSKLYDDGHREYTPTRSSSSWLTFSYGKKWQGLLMLGYYKNFGTAQDLCTDLNLSRDSVDSNSDGTVNDKEISKVLFFAKNSYRNLNQMYRIVPAVTYNIGKFTIGIEYELTSAQYGSNSNYNSRGLATDNLHWITNHRIQTMFRFNF